MRSFAFILISVLATGCATTPEGSGAASTTARSASAPPAAPQPVAAPAAPTTSAPAEPVAGAAKSGAAAESSGTDGGAKFLPPPGYRAVKKGNETVYCATVKPIGSNLTKTACYTQVQLEEVERRARGMRQDVLQKQSGCASTGGGCGGT